MAIKKASDVKGISVGMIRASGAKNLTEYKAMQKASSSQGFTPATPDHQAPKKSTPLIRPGSISGPSPSDSNYFNEQVTRQPQLKDMEVQRTSSGGTRIVNTNRSSYSSPSAPQTFTSSVLEQSFTNKEALQKAETDYYKQQENNTLSETSQSQQALNNAFVKQQLAKQGEQDKLESTMRDVGMSEAMGEEPRTSPAELQEKLDKTERAKMLLKSLSLKERVNTLNSVLINSAANIKQNTLASKAKIGTEMEEIARQRESLKDSVTIDPQQLFNNNNFDFEKENYFSDVINSRSKIISDFAKFKGQGFDAQNTLSSESNKTRQDIIDVVNIQPTGTPQERVGKVFAKASVVSKGLENQNIFRTGFEPVDSLSSNFVRGAGFSQEAISGLGGEIGKQTVYGSYKRAVTLKEELDELKKSHSKELPSYNISGQIQRDFDLVKASLAVTTSGTTLQGKTVKQIQDLRKEDLRFVKKSDFQKSLDIGGQAGRITAGIAPYFVGAGIPKAIIDIGASQSKEELALNVGTGFAVGAGLKVVSKTGQLIPLKLNKLLKGSLEVSKKGLIYGSKTAKASDILIKTTEKYGLPALSAGVIGVSGGSSVLAASMGDKETARQIEKNLLSTYGGMTIGGMVGGVVGQQLQRPIQKQVLLETGRQSLTGQKQKDFLDSFKYVYDKLPKKELPLKEFKVNELEILKELPAKSRAKVSKVTEKTLGEFKAEVIGSGVIVPQTKLKVTPKGKIGDVDVAKGSKELASVLAKRVGSVLPKGYTSKVYKKDFQGTDKYMVSILKSGKRLADGKNLLEFVNVGTSLTPTRKQFDLYEGKPFKLPDFSFKTTKSGTKILDLSSQAKAKLYGGYFSGRDKDLVDLKGIIMGTQGLPVKTGKLKTDVDVISGLKNLLSVKTSKNVLIPTKTGGIKQDSYYTTPKTINYITPSIVKQDKLINKKYSDAYNKQDFKPYTPKVIKSNDYTIPKEPSYVPIKKITIKRSIYVPPKPKNYYTPPKSKSYTPPKYKPPKIIKQNYYPPRKKDDYKIPVPPPYKPQKITKKDYIFIDDTPYKPPRTPQYKIPTTPPYKITSYTPPRQPLYTPPKKKDDFLLDWKLETDKDKKKMNKLFRFYEIRGQPRGGKKTKKFLGYFPLIKGLNIGAEKVGRNPSRTIKYVPTKYKTRTQDDLVFKYAGQFRQPKRKTKLKGSPQARFLVEKTKYAINSPGELAGITRKGIASPKKKNKSKRRKKKK